LIAKDPINDIAFLKVNDVSDLTPAEIGDSSKVQVGSFVVAIGNALGQFQNTVTTGVISGKSRPVTAADSAGSESLQNLFQTDAAINPGNSGGPLVNIDGQVIGINTAVAGQGSQNIGFAIPINEAIKDIESVVTNGKISRAYLGVRYVPLNAQIAKEYNLGVDYGAYIVSSQNGSSSVVAGSPADKAGLKNGDVILKIDNQKIDDKNSLTSLVGQKSPGDKVKLTIYRDGKEQSIDVILAEASTTS
jgi:serine protease Do